jgi:hypothetical protein
MLNDQIVDYLLAKMPIIRTKVFTTGGTRVRVYGVNASQQVLCGFFVYCNLE